MELFFSLKDMLYEFYLKAHDRDDSFESLIVSGDKDVDVLVLAIKLMEQSSLLGVEDSLSFSIDDEIVLANEIEDYIKEKYSFRCWKLVVSKAIISEKVIEGEGGVSIVLFFDEKAYLGWITGLDPLKVKNNVFACSSSVLVLAPGLKKSFGGSRLAVIPLEDKSLPIKWPSDDTLPSEGVIREHVHIVPSEPIRLCPRAFALSWGDMSNVSAKPFRTALALSLSSSLADVIYGAHCIVLKGFRHLELNLFAESDKEISSDFINLLQDALVWVYEERVDTRKKLLVDRLCLESINEDSFLSLLITNLDNALKQSKDQYRFVVLDRKDEYAKELRELLKDLRGQADLYAEKVRGLIAGLLRDSLAAFVFIALSLSSRLGADVGVLVSDIGLIFFKALGVYFIMSGALQITSSVIDLRLADRELAKWSEVTKEYISKVELDRRIKSDLSDRKAIFWVYVLLVLVIYFVLGLSSWNITLIVDFLLSLVA